MAKISVKQGSAAAVTSTVSTSNLVNSDSAANTGNDVIRVLEAIAGETYNLFGGDGNDTITGGVSNDIIFGGNYGFSSDNYSNNLKGGLGDDQVFGEAGNDTIDGGGGNDSLYGHNGNDNIKGGLGNDLLNELNYDGNDTLDGGDGDDYFYGGFGNDSIKGGKGNDTIDEYYPDYADGNDTMDGGDGNDYIMSGVGNDSVIGGKGNDDIRSGAGNDNVIGGAGDDYIEGSDGNDIIYGGAGNDRLFGDYGDDTISGGNGNDKLSDDNGDDVVNGDAGNDYFYAYLGNDVLNGGTGNDTFDLSFSDDVSESRIGNDTIDGGTGNDTVLISELSASNFKYTTASVNNVKTVTLTNLITEEVQTIKNVEKFTFEFDDVSFNLSDLTHTGTATYFEGYSPDDTLIATPNGATNNTIPTITITAQVGSEVEVFVNGDSVGTATETDDGEYEFNYSTLTEGTYSITAIATTPGGEEIETSEAETLTLTVDTTPPATPTVNMVSGGTINLSENAITTITGTGVFGNTVLLTFASGTTATATVASDGTWSYAVSDAATTFGQGSETITVKQVDAAGNQSTTGISTTFTVDTVAPTVTIDSFTGTSITFLSTETGSLLLNNAYAGALSTTVANIYAVNTVNADQATLTARDTAGNVVTVTYTGKPVVYAYGDQSVALTGDDITDAVLIAYAAPSESSSITGGDNRDYIYGNSGSETVSGRGGNDLIDVSSGNNTVDGGDGDDSIYYTGTGVNLISGGAGDDYIATDNSADTSSDALFGGAGDDEIYAGAGSDVVGFDSNDGTDTVNQLSFAASDKIVFFDSGATNTSTGSVNFAAGYSTGSTLYNFTSADEAYGGSYYEFATLTDLAIAQSSVQQDNKVLVVNSTNESDSMESITLSGLENAYILIQNGSNTEIWFDPNWGTTDARTLVATLVGVSTSALDVTDFGIYSSETLTTATV